MLHLYASFPLSQRGLGMLQEKVLCVDDEPRVGQGYARALRKVLPLDLASSGQEALEMVREKGPYAVVVSDMRMPGMDGLELLEQIEKISPDTVRIMLTGNIDMRTASEAINRGGVFRYLVKPCGARAFAEAVVEGVKKFQVRRAEREVLDCSGDGAAAVCCELLELIAPGMLDRVSVIEGLIDSLLVQLERPVGWSSAVLAPLALVGVAGEDSGGDAQQSAQFAELSAKIADAVPRLGVLSEGVRYQKKNYDGGGLPEDSLMGDQIPFVGRLLRVVLAFDAQCQRGFTEQQAYEALTANKAWFDPALLLALAEHLALNNPAVDHKGKEGVPVPVHELCEEMVLSMPVTTPAGTVLMGRGKVLTERSIERLKSFAQHEQIERNVWVYEPHAIPAQATP
ncbi:MAG: response regulator [Pseudomonadota bacterium]